MSDSDLELEDPWGQLIILEGGGGGHVERFPFSSSEITIGRSKSCDISFPDCKFLSSTHCKLFKDKEGRVFVRDTSTNGTLVRYKKLNKEEMQIMDGSLLKLVFNKESPGNNIVFKFRDLRPVDDQPFCEESVGASTLASMESTLPYSPPTHNASKESRSLGSKRSHTNESEGEDNSDVKKKKESTDSEEVERKDQTLTVGPTSSGPPPPPAPPHDNMGDNLVCGICQEIFHDCISLQPCMHSYCGGCYSEWMGRSNQCPECRSKVDRINKNHIVNNLVTSYFVLHPEKKRSEEDLKELDAKNKITNDMLYPKRGRRDIFIDSELSDSDSDGSMSEGESISASAVLFSTHSIFGPPLGSRPAPRTICRQCPGSIDSVSSTSTDVTPSHFVCPPFATHIMCQCCHTPMPYRSDGDPSIPPRKCAVCNRDYCHMYWGCRLPGCTGCLNKYRDMQLNPFVLINVVSDNTHESTILKDYLTSKGKGVCDLLKECLDKVSSGDYSLADDVGRPLGPDTVICVHCAGKYLKKLAYLYRKDIPSDDLPAEVTSRPDCHYGKNCRTQTHNPSHARRYNHICEQTRF